MPVYELASKEAATLAKALDTISNKLGNPTDCSTEAGWKVLDQCVAVWYKFFPQEVKDWIHDKKIDLANERSLSKHVDGFGVNMMAYPPSLFQLLRVMLPNQSLKDKDFLHKLLISHPILKATNYSI
jgi:hypothetical protein